MDSAYCVIADIVGSRDILDRSVAQDKIFSVLETVTGGDGALVKSVVAPWATVGDEFQIVFGTIEEALQATTLIMLGLADSEKLRFGIGRGAVVKDLPFPPRNGLSAPILDGDGWIAARKAIERAQVRSKKRHAMLSAFVTADSVSALGCSDEETVINSLLGMRDHIIFQMSPREARICFGALQGLTQNAIAAQEQVSQPAVSQSLQKSGGYALMELFA